MSEALDVLIVGAFRPRRRARRFGDIDDDMPHAAPASPTRLAAE
jgi:hypothetical protein